MQRKTIPTLIALILLASCGGIGSDRTTVQGTGPGEFLKLRSGPGLGYSIVLGLPDGTELTRRNCVTEVGQLWCRVSLSGSPRVSGYVSADYLSPS
jgi:uncharacterized protein YraI